MRLSDVSTFDARGTVGDAEVAPLARLGLPADYISEIRQTGGGAGFVGEGYLNLWSPTEIEKANEGHEVEAYMPGIVLFGSDGGGIGFGFDCKLDRRHFVSVPFESISPSDVRNMGNTFEEFLGNVSTGHPW